MKGIRRPRLRSPASGRSTSQLSAAAIQAFGARSRWPRGGRILPWLSSTRRSAEPAQAARTAASVMATGPRSAASPLFSATMQPSPSLGQAVQRRTGSAASQPRADGTCGGATGATWSCRRPRRRIASSPLRWPRRAVSACPTPPWRCRRRRCRRAARRLSSGQACCIPRRRPFTRRASPALCER